MMGRMPSSYGRSIAAISFAFALSFALLAHAQSTTAQQLLQALLPPNAVTPQQSLLSLHPFTTAVTPRTPSSTLSASAKATLLQSLYAELQTLEAEIAALEAAANQHCTPLNITRNLAIGSTGTDVTQLQQFLANTR